MSETYIDGFDPLQRYGDGDLFLTFHAGDERITLRIESTLVADLAIELVAKAVGVPR